jgi:2-aminoadipate transaminase
MAQLGWSSVISRVNRESIVPIYQQIYEGLREAILTGALPEQSRLPPERSFAEALGVNRSTVVHAYRRLATDCLIEQRVGSGSWVARSIGAEQLRNPEVPWWVTLPPWGAGRFPAVLGELAATHHEDKISFVQGVPPSEPSPLRELAVSFERVAGDPNYVLSYGNSEGHDSLREVIAARMRRRGCTLDVRNVLVLTGSTQGITLVAQSLAEPGDEIIIEQPTYPGALQIFQIAGLRTIPVVLDEEGMRVDHVEAILRTRRPRFIYTMPSLHNPTGVNMNADRRKRLIAVAERARVPIIEDDPYGELAVGDIAPLAMYSKDHVIYLSTFSKTIAPSLRLGWLTAPRAIYERLLLRKQSYDMATSLYVQASVCDFLERAYDDHVVKLRDELTERRRAAREAVSTYWSKTIRLAGGVGGFYLWATASREMRGRALLENAERFGASFLFGEAFFPGSGGDHNFRLAITPMSRERMIEGIRRIGVSLNPL